MEWRTPPPTEWKFGIFYVWGMQMLMILSYTNAYHDTKGAVGLSSQSVFARVSFQSFVYFIYWEIKMDQHQPLKHGSKNLQVRNYNLPNLHKSLQKQRFLTAHPHTIINTARILSDPLESQRLRCRPFCTRAQRPKFCIQNGHDLL